MTDASKTPQATAPHFGQFVAVVGSAVGTVGTFIASARQISQIDPGTLSFILKLLGYIGVLTVQTLFMSLLFVFTIGSFWTEKFGDKGILIGVAGIGVVELILIASGIQDISDFFYYPWLPALTGALVLTYGAYSIWRLRVS